MAKVTHISSILESEIQRMKEGRPDLTPERPEHRAVIESLDLPVEDDSVETA